MKKQMEYAEAIELIGELIERGILAPGPEWSGE